MINRQSQAFSCNSGNNCTQNHVISIGNYVIGGSVVLFGKNRVLKLAMVNKIVRV